MRCGMHITTEKSGSDPIRRLCGQLNLSGRVFWREGLEDLQCNLCRMASKRGRVHSCSKPSIEEGKNATSAMVQVADTHP